jgi:hypothetical protein
MKAITQTSYSPSYKAPIQFTLFNKFFKWCEAQEKNHLGWLALSLASQGCIITPLVILTIGITGNNLILWMAGMIAMGITLIVNLAAMPTKITIPVFVLSVVIDIGIVVSCVLQYTGSFSA